jgi:hypothetical protein
VAGLLAATLLVVLTMRASGAHAASPAPTPVTLLGEGASDPTVEMTAWHNDLYGTSGAIDLTYAALGGYQGRQDFLAGNVDYVISGVPFTSSELAHLPHGSSDLIDAPVHVSAMGMLLIPPNYPPAPGFGVVREPCDPDNPPNPPPPDNCLDIIPYKGPIRVPNAQLASLMISQQFNWDDPAILASLQGLNMTQGNDFAPPVFYPPGAGHYPTVVLRSEPSETDYYVQQYAVTANPQAWAGVQESYGRTFGPITERLPINVLTRPGVDSQITALEGDLTGNRVAPLPPFALGRVQTDAPNLNPEWIQVQNKSGQWAAPTPDSIDAAVNEGQNSPLYALSNPDPVGARTPAYPLVWVDHLYAPAHGLPVEKIEALATTIRYLATAGQAVSHASGDGQLSDQLRAQALTAANQLVVSNCTGPNMSLTVSSDPGPYAPSLPALQNLGAVAHCTQTPVTPSTTTTTAHPTTTTTVKPTATTTPAPTSTTSPTTAFVASAEPTPSGPSGPGDAPQAVSQPAPAASTLTGGGNKGPPSQASSAAVVAAGKSQGNSPILLARLPLPMPWGGGGGFDRLTGLVLGAALFLLARKPARRLLGVRRE